jgi:hypothetical protein
VPLVCPLLASSLPSLLCSLRWVPAVAHAAIISIRHGIFLLCHAPDNSTQQLLSVSDHQFSLSYICRLCASGLGLWAMFRFTNKSFT